MSDHQILEFALTGDHPVLAILREQLSQATLSARDYTGVGYYTNITVSAQACRLPSSRLVIHDVHAEVTGLEHGAGFAVFLEEGALSLLEGFCYEDAWPTDATVHRLFYMHHDEQGSPSLVEVTPRDLKYVFK
jgi:hypothetical protein